MSIEDGAGEVDEEGGVCLYSWHATAASDRLYHKTFVRRRITHKPPGPDYVVGNLRHDQGVTNPP